jgi:hypothetical protein
MLNENKPWQSVFTPCRLPLKVSALPYLLFLTSIALLYLLTLVSFFFSIVQNLPGYLRHPCQQTMIL